MFRYKVYFIFLEKRQITINGGNYLIKILHDFIIIMQHLRKLYGTVQVIVTLYL